VLAKSKRLCFNCLKAGHFPKQCSNAHRCKNCQKVHHSTLHRASPSSPDAPVSPPDNQAVDPSNNTASVNLLPSKESQSQAPLSVITTRKEASPNRAAIYTTQKSSTSVLLATAWVRLRTPADRVIKARALID